MKYLHFVVFSAVIVVAFSQRSPYAGRNPVGYPVIETTTTTADPLGNRFGSSSETTEPMPIEALGDRDLVNRLSKLPVDKQPFWLVNWRALEAQRKNQQTFDLRPNPFINDPSFNVQSVNQNRVPNVNQNVVQK